MIRIGIAGSDEKILSIVNQINSLEGIEVTGFVLKGTGAEDAIPNTTLICYPSLEALFHYVDAVLLSYDVSSDVGLIAKCLKNFKHVFSADARMIRYEDLNYLQKIAEESNVLFYPELGEPAFTVPAAAAQFSSQVNYLDIHHSLENRENENSLYQCLFQDLNLVMSMIQANVKKINASCWDGCESGQNVLNTRLDFDNGSTANILITNSIYHKFFVVAYGPAAKTEMIIEKNNEKIIVQPYSGDPIMFTEFNDRNIATVNNIAAFVAALNQLEGGLKSLANRLSSLRVNYLVHEKIKNYTSRNILYS